MNLKQHTKTNPHSLLDITHICNLKFVKGNKMLIWYLPLSVLHPLLLKEVDIEVRLV